MAATAPVARHVDTAVARSFNFGSGMPDPATFPSRELAEAAMRIVSQVGEVLVKYPDPKGWPALREIAVERMRNNHGVSIPLDQVVLTNGSMQAIGLAGLGLAGAGATIVFSDYNSNIDIKAPI
jgi:2-aminoadipate transaminase